MADYESPVPDFAVQQKTEYDTIISEFENGVEQRRARRSQKRREWILNFRNRTAAELASIQSLFDSKKGALTAFTWLHPVDGNTYDVRFRDDGLEVTNHNFGFYDFQFALIEVL